MSNANICGRFHSTSKKVEKHCPKCSVPAGRLFPFLSSCRVTIISGASCKARVANLCAKLYAVDDFKWRILLIVIKQDSKPPQYFIVFLFCTNHLRVA